MKYFLLIFIFFGCSHKHIIQTEQVSSQQVGNLKEQYIAQSLQAFRIGELIVSKQKNHRTPRPLLAVFNVENLFFRRNIDQSQIDMGIGGLTVDWDFAPGSLSLLEELKNRKISVVFYCTRSLNCDTFRELLSVADSKYSKWKFIRVNREEDFNQVANRIQSSELILYMSNEFLSGHEFSQIDLEHLRRSWISLPEISKSDLTF